MIGLCFAVILVSWFGGVPLSQGHSTARRDRGRQADRLGVDARRARLRRHEPRGGSAASSPTRLLVPLPALDKSSTGFEFLGVILVTAIPFGIYDLVEAMDNVESAEAAGDHLPTTAC